MFEVGKYFQEAFFIKKSLPNNFFIDIDKGLKRLDLEEKRLLYSTLRHALPLSLYLDIHYPKWKKKKNSLLGISFLFLALDERIYGKISSHHTYQWLNRSLTQSKTDWLKPIARSMLEKIPDNSENFFMHIEEKIFQNPYLSKILKSNETLDWKLLFGHPPLWISVRNQSIAEQVPDQDIIEKIGLSISLKKTSEQTTRLFFEGSLSFQNISSQLMEKIFPTLLHYVDGDIKQIIETCSAPGGKSRLILEHFSSEKIKILMTDLNESKVTDLEKNLLRIYPDLHKQYPLLETSVHDWTKGFIKKQAQLIFIDAPCSGSGVTRKHPDVLWRDNCEGLQQHIDAQKTILKNALLSLAPGGIIVYSTCSIDPDENSKLIACILQEHSSLKSIDVDIPFSIKQTYGYQILPSDRCDGLYICALKKN
jgi:16S rRNA (cytosine967-C5)-methyltransferase